MPQLKVITNNDNKIYPVTIASGIYDNVNNQLLTKTLEDKVNTTVFNSAIEDNKTFAALITLANNFLCGATWEVSDNPEYSYVLVDSDDKVIAAKKVDDDTWVLGDDIDTLFSSIIDTIDNTDSRTLSEFRISDAYTKTEVDTLLDDGYYTKPNVVMLVASMIIAFKDSTYSIEENPEWKFVFLDSEEKVIFGIKEDNTLYQGLEWSELLDSLISNYTEETEVATVGTYENVPTSPSVGQSYFCTDKQTTEGATDGIVIYWNGTSWVDALGRTVETTDSSEDTGTTETTDTTGDTTTTDSSETTSEEETTT